MKRSYSSHLHAALIITISMLYSFPSYTMEPCIHLCADSGNIEKLKVRLGMGADVNIRDNVKRTALHRAARAGTLEIARLLINAGIDIHAQDLAGATALHYAVERDNPELATLIISRGADICSIDNHGDTPFMYAARAGNTLICERLHALRSLTLLSSFKQFDVLNKFQSFIHRHNNNNDTALHYAAENGRTDTCRYLLDNGSDLEAINSYMRQPLHCATFIGHTATVALLLARHAPFTTPDGNKQLPIHTAASEGNKAIVALLLAHGSPLEEKNFIGNTPFNLSLMRLHYDLAWELLNLLEHVERTHSTQFFITHTALPLAALSGSVPFIRKLLARGALLSSTNSNGQTALHFAAQGKPPHTSVLKYLIASGADRHARNAAGATPLRDALDTRKAGLIVPFLTIPQRIPPVLITALLMHKFRKDSYIGQMNKDVFRSHLLPHLIEDAVQWQLAEIRTLLNTPCIPHPYQRLLINEERLESRTPLQHVNAYLGPYDITTPLLLDPNNCTQFIPEITNNLYHLLQITRKH